MPTLHGFLRIDVLVRNLPHVGVVPKVKRKNRHSVMISGMACFVEKVQLKTNIFIE